MKLEGTSCGERWIFVEPVDREPARAAPWCRCCSRRREEPAEEEPAEEEQQATPLSSPRVGEAWVQVEPDTWQLGLKCKVDDH